MPNHSDSPQNTVKKVSSAESFLLKHGGIKSSHEEYIPNALLPSMREVIQQNTSNLLRRIRNQLKEFATFVEDMQSNNPSEKQSFASFSFPKPTRSSSTKAVQPIDPRPKNAALRDALQMVRNLLSRITKVIDQVTVDIIDDEDNQSRDVQSPNFNYYYTQYVFQMMYCILQTVGEELEQFCQLLAEVSVDDILSKLPSKVDEIDASLSNHEIRREMSEYFSNSEPSHSSSRTSSEESSSSANDNRSKLKKQGLEALELVTFLSKKLLHYFQEKGLPQWHEIHQREFSKRALGVPDLCRNCSKKVARKLRRYTSRENLFAEKYEKSSDQSLFSPDSSQSSQGHQTLFTAGPRRSRLSDSQVLEMPRALENQRSATVRTCLDSRSTHISDTEIKMTYEHSLKSFANWIPLISGQSDKVSATDQMNGVDDKVVAVITVTEDPGKSEKIEFPKQSGEIHFNIQKFCFLLKEQFRTILSEERKADTSQSETTESYVISNILIRCFREATQDRVRFDVTAHNSRDTDARKDSCSSKPSGKEAEKQLDGSLVKFVVDTHQLAVAALEKKKKSSGGL